MNMANVIAMQDQLVDPKLLYTILRRTYDAAIEEPKLLNNYKSFSSEMYGEVGFDLIKNLILHLPITSDDIFLDLGSGIGQVVLQIAGCGIPLKRCLGIEKMELPSSYAGRMEEEFRRQMKSHGLSWSNIKLMHADFTSKSIKVENMINSASVIFVNNFGFDAKLNNWLKDRFARCTSGTRIVAITKFCKDRACTTSSGSFDNVSSLVSPECLKGSVSWTGKAIQLHIYTINKDEEEKKQKQKEEQVTKFIAENGLRDNNNDYQRVVDSFGNFERNDFNRLAIAVKGSTNKKPHEFRARGRPSNSTKAVNLSEKSSMVRDVVLKTSVFRQSRKPAVLSILPKHRSFIVAKNARRTNEAYNLFTQEFGNVSQKSFNKWVVAANRAKGKAEET